MRKSKDNKNVVVNGVTFNHDKTELIKYPAKRRSSFYAIPNEVKIIASYAFENCRNLTTLFIPRSIESIDLAAFHGCNNLRNILMPKFSDFSFENGRLYKKEWNEDKSEKNDITDTVFYPDIDYHIPED